MTTQRDEDLDPSFLKTIIDAKVPPSGLSEDRLEHTVKPDVLVALLGVYGTQFASYTTLLWQVPALSLTAQAFLLTIALNSMSTPQERMVASGLSLAITAAAVFLMHNHRGHAINHGFLAARVGEGLWLRDLLGPLSVTDATPKLADGVAVGELSITAATEFGRVVSLRSAPSTRPSLF